MNRRLTCWIVLAAVFVGVLTIAIFFLDDPVTRILLGISGALGAIVSLLTVSKIASQRRKAITEKRRDA